MKYYPASLALLLLCLLLSLAARPVNIQASAQDAPPPDERAETIKKYEEVFKRPFDVAARTAYMESLPRVDDYYIVEGDIALTEQELRAYILTQSSGTNFAAPDTAELIANKYGGEVDYYRNPARRKLTYAVDKKSFANSLQYELVVNSMAQAGKSWKDACPTCGVDFIYKGEFDDNPSTNKVNFVVRAYNMRGKLVALSFFPHDDASERFLNIDPSYFKPAMKTLSVGVLRHELGHVLGYRHEHIRPESGCYFGTENNQWVTLTPYNANSVMHYFCEGDATNLTLELTTVDKEGHRKLYGPTQTSNASFTASSAAGFTLNQTSPAKARTIEAYRRVMERPFESEAVKRFMAELPRDGDYYVVEGDLLLSEQELRAYIVDKSLGPSPANPSTSELIVNLYEGERDFYKDPRKRELTYAVDRASFPNPDHYQQVVKNMKQAGEAWKKACPECGVRFTHQKEFDGNPSKSNASFTVRYRDSSGAYVAAAFFPHDDASERFLNIDPSYFTPALKSLSVGVLRHELGHVLGYRHEHTRGVAGCYYEDNEWEMLTDYDDQSVMHYFCGGAGNPRLELSQSDKAGHRKLYRPYSVSSISYLLRQVFGPKLTIRLEGGDVAENGAKVLATLTELNVVSLNTHKVDQGETLESIYRSKLDFPFFSATMKELADKLNRAVLLSRELRAGEKVTFPDIEFDDYDFSIEFNPNLKRDLARLEELRNNWDWLIQKQDEKAGLINVTLKGFELKLRVDSDATLQRVQDQLMKLNLSPTNVLIMASDKTESAQRNVFYADDQPVDPIYEPIDKFWTDYMIGKGGKFQENIQADLVLLSVDDRRSYRNEVKKCNRGGGCPTVILIDQPVQRHPDIAPALIGGDEVQGPKDLLAGGMQQLEIGAYDKDNDHGTFMAGIIASQDNRFGLIGLDPGASLVPFRWTVKSKTDNEDGIALEREMQRRNGGSSLPIYVFASQWDYAVCGNVENMINSNPVARKIRRLQTPLWVVAAGNTDTNKGDDLDPNYCKGPMNLGHLPNVLVVTAYSPDNKGVPHLLPGANFSRFGLVHIAGPGGDTISTIQSGKYVRNNGTSPATAFVAGVASAMANAWPYYGRGERLKFRLQLTATPSLDPQDAKRVVSGIINPVLALADPEQTWFKRLGGSPEAITPVCWKSQTLQLLHPVNKSILANGVVNTDQIRRIYRVPDTSPAQWIIYTVALDEDEGQEGEIKPGQIMRLGPGLIDFKDTDPIIMTNSGSLSLSVISDLILSESHALLGVCSN